jgi:hypothetical protein
VSEKGYDHYMMTMRLMKAMMRMKDLVQVLCEVHESFDFQGKHFFVPVLLLSPHFHLQHEVPCMGSLLLW